MAQEPPNPNHRSGLLWILFLLFAGIIILAVVPQLVHRVEGSHRTSPIADISNLKTALDIFQTDIGRYPTAAEGLDALLSNTIADPKWGGPYITKPPLDKWDRPHIYRCPGIDDPTSYDLISAGPDGIFGTKDDITKNTEY